MGRTTRILIILAIMTLPFAAMFVYANPPAQPPIFNTVMPPPVNNGGNNNSGGGPPFSQPGDSSGGGQPPFAQTTEEAPPPAVSVPTATPTPTMTPTPAPSVGATTVFAARSDLERLADETTANRPEGWIGATQLNDPSAVINTRLDLEILAGTLLGANTRPPGWFGVVPSSEYAVARDIRHDLELLADTVLEAGRPSGWIGDDPLMRCDRSTQAVVEFLQLNGVFTLNADPAAQDYCQQATIQAATFMEINILSNPDANRSLSVSGLGLGGGSAAVNSDFAAAFLDRFASQRVGVVPNGATFEAVGRSPGEFSNMMLIEGQGYLVFVDYQFTSITSEQFRSLPPVDDASISPNCQADWCGR